MKGIFPKISFNVLTHPPIRPQRRFAPGIAALAVLALFATAAHGASGTSTNAPANASVPPATTVPTPAPPLTDAQKAVLKGKLGDFVTQFAAATGIRLVPIPAGSFVMGEGSGLPAHPVKIARPFLLGATDVTQLQWTTMMGSNPSQFKGDSRPVETVLWKEAVAFCQKLTERERAAGRLPDGCAFALPMEAQWEFACRAGGAPAGKPEATEWYSENSGGRTQPVGMKQPNAWGLYDMLGNVEQWCADWYEQIGPGDTFVLPGESIIEPYDPKAGLDRVVRGGSWMNNLSPYGVDLDGNGYLKGGGGLANAGTRAGFPPNQAGAYLGFRIALVLPPDP